MGDFDNIGDHKVSRRRAAFGGQALWPLSVLTSVALALLIGSSAPAIADESQGPTARSNPAEPAAPPSGSEATWRSSEASVSTSPQALVQRTTPGALEQAGDDSSLRPLTRAAARQQVAAMNPVDWLAAYGDVTIAPAN